MRITLTCIPFFILFVILIPFSESHVLNIRCIGDFLKPDWNSFSNLWDYFLKEVLSTDEESEETLIEKNELSKKVEKIEERLTEVEKSLACLPKCHIDEDPSRKTQKCDIDSDGYSHTSTEKCSMPKAVAQNTEILENVIEKPLYVISNVINFKSETNININDKSLPISPDYGYPFKFITDVLLVFIFMLIIVGLMFRFYQPLIQAIRKLFAILFGVRASYKAGHSDARPHSETRDTVATNNADDSEERVDSGNRSTEENTTIIEEWTPGKVYDHLKRISEIALRIYPRNEYVQYLSDEFLIQIANFIADQGCFRNFERYLTPEELLEHARHHRHLLQMNESRQNERKIHVIVNVDGQQIQTADLESSSSI